jgi:hypothetical protein
VRLLKAAQPIPSSSTAYHYAAWLIGLLSAMGSFTHFCLRSIRARHLRPCVDGSPLARVLGPLQRWLVRPKAEVTAIGRKLPVVPTAAFNRTPPVPSPTRQRVLRVACGCSRSPGGRGAKRKNPPLGGSLDLGSVDLFELPAIAVLVAYRRYGNSVAKAVLQLIDDVVERGSQIE